MTHRASIGWIKMENMLNLGDVIVYRGNFYDALDSLKQVWQRVREANLKLKPSKYCLFARLSALSWTLCVVGRS